jgi:hypothetical protein
MDNALAPFLPEESSIPELIEPDEASPIRGVDAFNRQLLEERAVLMTRIDGLEGDAEKMLTLIESLRKELGDEKYFAIASVVFSSEKYRSIGYHKTKDE